MADSKPKNGGTKRKHKFGEEAEDLTDRLAAEFFQGLKEVKRAAKKAKAFETQRLVKRLKAPSQGSVGGHEVEQIETQLSSLKRMDHDRIAVMALKNKLKKDKVLSKSPNIGLATPNELSLAALSPSTGPDAQVEGRVLSSKALSSAVNTVISTLRSLLRPQSLPLDISIDSSPPPKQKRKLSPVMTSEKLTPGGHPAEPSRHSDDDGWESGTVDGGSHSSADDGSTAGESGSEVTAPSARKSVIPLSISSTSKRAPSAPTTAGSQSTFLPSLSHGFIRGDSDSDWSDGEAAIADVKTKNRRGQRARRAIWEKKYGRGAKHLNVEHASTSRAPEQHGGPRVMRSVGRSTSHSQHRPPDNLAPPRKDDLQKSNKDIERPLHPSWEAKRKLKERESGAIIASQNTRVVFND
ncbi:Bud-site selection protein [Auriscalpium vulgare]|uniref:Bud-site selection protein n=1 Tax=Auriscalpium vulgare TaxID=40419 RepID=A0ACB8RJU1_9AGAM|nr:Bud-site selection protein [Auriscalpium vulgare]